MVIEDIQKAQELCSTLADGIAMQQEILSGLIETLLSYSEFLKQQIKENQNEIRIFEHE